MNILLEESWPLPNVHTAFFFATAEFVTQPLSPKAEFSLPTGISGIILYTQLYCRASMPYEHAEIARFPVIKLLFLRKFVSIFTWNFRILYIKLLMKSFEKLKESIHKFSWKFAFYRGFGNAWRFLRRSFLLRQYTAVLEENVVRASRRCYISFDGNRIYEENSEYISFNFSNNFVRNVV